MKQPFFRHFFAGFFFLITLPLVAQSELFLPCGINTATKRFIGDDSVYQRNRRDLENFTAVFAPDNSLREAAKIIPVVVHIIHNYGAENISDEQVFDAMRIVNEDFRKLNADISQVVPAFSSVAADAGFEFRLARKDPQGKCTNGITRTLSVLTYNADDNVKGLISWPTNRYLNIWVVQNISFGAGGYAYLPGTSIAAGVDGIVVVNRQFGSIGTSSGINFAARTLTHEIGHWLNLLHVWGEEDIGTASNCIGLDDYVQDTPKTIGTVNISCNLSQNSCTNETPDKVDNVQNYMDYSACALMFTTGQKNRMVAASNSSVSGRNNVWSASNLAFTGVNNPAGVCTPIVDFRASTSMVCPDAPVSLSDRSYNATVDASWRWSWQMPGGTPATSDQRNTAVRYANPGVYPVTLTVTNSAGTATLTKSQFIYVNTDEPLIAAPVNEGFESGSFPNATSDFNKNWRFDGPTNSMARTTSAATSGTYSLKYQNLLQPERTEASLISPPLSFREASSPAQLTFKVAYARRNTESSDKLEVFISTDCGKTWSRRFSKTGANLATVNNTITAAFNPTATQWRSETVNISTLAGAAKAMIRFTVTDGNGNNLYLDDINILENIVGIEVNNNQNNYQIFPNPGKGDALLEWPPEGKPEPLSVGIYDISGRINGTLQLEKSALKGANNIRLSDICGSMLSPGLYFVQIRTAGNTYTVKWIAQ